MASVECLHKCDPRICAMLATWKLLSEEKQMPEAFKKYVAEFILSKSQGCAKPDELNVGFGKYLPAQEN